MDLTKRLFETRSGLVIAADTGGPGTAGHVLLAHGAGQTRNSWRGTALRLAGKGYGVTSMDLRGHGESGWAADGDYQMLRFAEDLLDVARQLPDKVSVIGASLGGLSSLIIESKLAPGTFRSLTLVDILPRTDAEGGQRIMGFMGQNAETGFATLEEAADTISAFLPHRKRPDDLSGLAKNLREGEDGRWYWHWDPAFISGMRSTGTSELMTDFADACLEIAAPIHVVRGRMSELVSLEAAQAFVAGARDAVLTDVADAHHMVAGDRNDVFTDAVLGFLAAKAAAPV